MINTGWNEGFSQAILSRQQSEGEEQISPRMREDEEHVPVRGGEATRCTDGETGKELFVVTGDVMPSALKDGGGAGCDGTCPGP